MAMVSSEIAEPPVDETISLYFRLRDSEKADLEIVATAALEWLAAVRAAARELDPGAKVRVGIVDATEGSLTLRTVFDWVETQLERIETGTGRYPRLWKLAIALAIFVPTTGIPTYNFYLGPSTAALSPEDRKLLEDQRRLLNELLERMGKNPEVQSKRKQFFKTVERDPSITGAGILEGDKKAPLILVPSDQFAENGGLWAMVEAEPEERTIYPVLDVTLVAPVLLPVPRSWKFQPVDGLPAFSAVMRDAHFLAAIEEAHVRENLRTGIRMTVRLQVKERNVGGVWLVKRGGRSVVDVISPKVD